MTYKTTEIRSFGHLVRQNKKDDIQSEFAKYFKNTSFNDLHFLLHQFCKDVPFSFYRVEAIEEILGILKKDANLTLQAITENSDRLSHAIASMFRPNRSWEIQDYLALDKPGNLVIFEEVVHPEYQRYIEHVWNHLIGILLTIIGKRNTKDYTGQTLANRIGVLKNKKFLESCKGVDAAIRNAISHGAVRYGFQEIIYRSNKTELRLSSREVQNLLDLLIETCNSIAIALFLYIAEKHTHFVNDLPLGVLFVLIKAMTSYNEVSVLSLTENTILDSRKQLNVIVQINTQSRSIHLYEAVGLATLINQFTNQYDRVTCSFDCGYPIYPIVIFNQRVLKDALEARADLADPSLGIVEHALLWYETTRFQRTLWAWQTLAKIQVENFRSLLVSEFRSKGIPLYSSDFEILYTENTSTGKFRRLEVYVFLKKRGDIKAEELINILDDVIKQARKKRAKKTNIYGETGIALAPDVIVIRGFQHRRSLRSYKSTNSKDSNLLFVAEWKSTLSKYPYFYTKQADFFWKRLRVKVNPLVKAS